MIYTFMRKTKTGRADRSTLVDEELKLQSQAGLAGGNPYFLCEAPFSVKGADARALIGACAAD